MRKIVLLLIMAIFLIAATCSFAADVQGLLEERTVMLHPEGQVLGNMVLGARGKIQFIYVDRTLAKAVQDDPLSPDWLGWNVRHWGTDPVKGKTLFIIRYEAYKPWSFSPGDITIGGRNIEPGDILTRKAFIVEGELPGGTLGIIAVAVPSETASPGRPAVFGYSDASAEWTVPGK